MRGEQWMMFILASVRLLTVTSVISSQTNGWSVGYVRWTVKWTENWLNCEAQRFLINNSTRSSCRPDISGVWWVSTRGPTVFDILFKDLDDGMSHFQWQQEAHIPPLSLLPPAAHLLSCKMCSRCVITSTSSHPSLLHSFLDCSEVKLQNWRKWVLKG